MATEATTALTCQDYFSTTLSSDITSTTTTISLASLPTGSEGFLVIDPDNSSKEIIFYNASGGGAVTVPSTGDRGRGGTTAVSHTSGATVKMHVVADYWKKIQSGVAISANAITTTKIINDAVTDAKLIKGKVLRRQGGSATSWGLAGSTTYDVSATDVSIQCGTVGTDAGSDVTITFPVAFSYPPVLTCSVTGGNAGDTAITANCFAECVQATATQATFRTFNTSAGQSNQAVGWIAVGVTA